MESLGDKGDSPVHGIERLQGRIQSSAGHEESCVKKPGPSGKAKYYLKTDSEQVLWRKGEKNLEQRSEIEPETIRLQAVGADTFRDHVPFA